MGFFDASSMLKIFLHLYKYRLGKLYSSRRSGVVTHARTQLNCLLCFSLSFCNSVCQALFVLAFHAISPEILQTQHSIAGCWTIYCCVFVFHYCLAWNHLHLVTLCSIRYILTFRCYCAVPRWILYKMVTKPNGIFRSIFDFSLCRYRMTESGVFTEALCATHCLIFCYCSLTWSRIIFHQSTVISFAQYFQYCLDWQNRSFLWHLHVRAVSKCCKAPCLAFFCVSPATLSSKRIGRSHSPSSSRIFRDSALNFLC